MAASRRLQKIVVIGAGIGGLCAAIRLAIAGAQVTLIEAHPTPGGKMRAIPSAAGPIDAGPTVLTLRHVIDDLFHAAGENLNDHLTMIRQPILARHFWPDGSQLDLHSDPALSAAAINAFAGAKAEQEFRAFDRLSTQLYRAFDAPVMQAVKPHLPGILRSTLQNPTIWPALNRSLSQHLSKTFTDPRLRQLFGRYATYVSGSPDLSPAVLSLIWHAEAQGVWAVQGGMRQLAQALAALAHRLNVTLRCNTAAAQILRQSGRVTSVVLSDTRTLKCDAVVFNGDPAALLAGLLGTGPQQALKPHSAQPCSLSAYVWSFAATPSALPLLHHNVLFCADPTTEFGPLAQGQMPDEATLYLCAQDRAHGPASAPERFEIILNAPAKTSLSAKEALEFRAKTFSQLAHFGLTFSPSPRTQP